MLVPHARCSVNGGKNSTERPDPSYVSQGFFALSQSPSTHPCQQPHCPFSVVTKHSSSAQCSSSSRFSSAREKAGTDENDNAEEDLHLHLTVGLRPSCPFRSLIIQWPTPPGLNYHHTRSRNHNYTCSHSRSGNPNDPPRLKSIVYHLFPITTAFQEARRIPSRREIRGRRRKTLLRATRSDNRLCRRRRLRMIR